MSEANELGQSLTGIIRTYIFIILVQKKRGFIISLGKWFMITFFGAVSGKIHVPFDSKKMFLIQT